MLCRVLLLLAALCAAQDSGATPPAGADVEVLEGSDAERAEAEAAAVDDADAVAASVAEAEAQSAAAAGDDANATNATGGATDQYQDLQDKFAVLQELLEKRGDSVDKDTIAKVQSIKAMVDSIKKSQDSVKSPALSDERMRTCMLMTLARDGMNNARARGLLKRFGEGNVTKDEASGTPFFRKMLVCIGSMSEAEIMTFSGDGIVPLPIEYVKSSEEAELTEVIKTVEDGVWKKIIRVAKLVQKQLSDVPVRAKPTVHWALALPVLGLFLAAVGFVVYKFLELQKEKAKKVNRKREAKEKATGKTA